MKFNSSQHEENKWYRWSNVLSLNKFCSCNSTIARAIESHEAVYESMSAKVLLFLIKNVFYRQISL